MGEGEAPSLSSQTDNDCSETDDFQKSYGHFFRARHFIMDQRTETPQTATASSTIRDFDDWK